LSVLSSNTSGKSPKNWRALQFSIIAAAIGLRLLVLALLRAQPLLGDPSHYHQIARKILHGISYYPEWPPGLPHYLSFAYLFLGESEVAARIATLFLFVAFALLFRKLMIDLVGEKLATFGLMTLAIYPAFVHHSVDALSHLPVALCLTIAMLCVIRLLRGASWWYALAMGLAIGAMVLVRASNAMFLIAIPAFVYWKRRDWKLPVVSVAAGLVLLGFWLERAHTLAGEFIWVNSLNNYNFFIGNSEFTPMYKTWWIGSHGGEGLQDSARFVQLVDSAKRLSKHDELGFYSARSREYILSEPGKFLVRSINRFNGFFSFESFTAAYVKNVSSSRLLIFATLALDALCFLVLLFFTIAVLTLHWRDVRSNSLMLLAVIAIVIHGFPYWISFASPVYHFAILPLMLLLSLHFFKISPPSSWKSNWRKVYTKKQRIAFAIALLYGAFIQMQFMYHMAGRA
jgi:4-amino-4-deoxy-L-arabinose transferase-like glycosyltransferase